jgi:hypothetical protein
VDKITTLPDVTVPDMERLFRIMYLKLYLMISTAPFALLVAVYEFFCMLSVLGFWASSVIENVPVDLGRQDH